MANDQNYLHRMTCLFSINVLAEAVEPEITKSVLLPTVLNLAKDKVANVRFNVAKTLLKIAPLLDDDTIQKKVKPSLTTLLSDHDVDVRFFSEETASRLSIS